MKAFPAILVSRSSVTFPAIVTLSVFLLAAHSFGATSGTADSTYSALTGKNTSAGTFAAQTATGTPSENVSKTPITSLLPAGTNARIYAHFLTWFGTTSHQDVGYSSTDTTQVQKQVNDMLSRGIGGAIVNWQGRGDSTDQAAGLVMAESELHAGKFEFSIEEDAQALAQCAANAGCDLAVQVESDLTYIQNTYATATTYMKFNGRPVIFLYGMEAYNLDWNKIRTSLSGNPVLMFRSAESGACSQPTQSGGA